MPMRYGGGFISYTLLNDTRRRSTRNDRRARYVDIQRLIQKTKKGGTIYRVIHAVLPSRPVDPSRLPLRVIDPSRLPSRVIDPFRLPSRAIFPSRAIDPLRLPSRAVDPSGAIDPVGLPSRAVDPSGLVHIPGAIHPVGHMAGLVDPSGLVHIPGSVDNAGLVFPSRAVDPSGLVDVLRHVHDVGDVPFAPHRRFCRGGRAPAQPPLVLVGPPIGPRRFVAEPVAATSRGVRQYALARERIVHWTALPV